MTSLREQLTLFSIFVFNFVSLVVGEAGAVSLQFSNNCLFLGIVVVVAPLCTIGCALLQASFASSSVQG